MANFADDVEPDPDARIITATCGGVRVSSVYVPNGRSLDDDHYTYKLSWLDRLVAHLDADTDPAQAVIVAGDFNIAPTIATCTTRPSSSARPTSASPSGTGWPRSRRGVSSTSSAQHHDGDRLYSWWDYRAGDFHQGRGMRIDLMMCSASVAARVEWCVIDRNARKGKQPSDHAPVIVDLSD